MGGTFTLDTSGCVRLKAKDAPWKGLPKPDIYWSDLSPFVQGYIEAAIASYAAPSGDFCPACCAAGIWHCGEPTRREEDGGCGQRRLYAFSDLAPETLAAILKDCEANRAKAAHLGLPGDIVGTHQSGGDFWRIRQAGNFPSFPPVHLSLSDDGKVRMEARS